MKLSKIILLSFFCLFIVTCLFYTTKILGADNQSDEIKDYQAINFGKNISTIVMEDGWSVTAYVGHTAARQSSKYINFDIEADSSETEQLLKIGKNGLILNRYIAHFDDEILKHIELRGDSLVFKELSTELSSLLSLGRLRINLAEIENIQMKGKSRLILDGGGNNKSLNLPQLNIVLEDEAYLSIRQLWADAFKLIANSRTKTNWSPIYGRVVDVNGELVFEYDDRLGFKAHSSIELSGMASLNLSVENVELDDIDLKDEAWLNFNFKDVVMTQYGAITKSNGVRIN